VAHPSQIFQQAQTVDGRSVGEVLPFRVLDRGSQPSSGQDLIIGVVNSGGECGAVNFDRQLSSGVPLYQLRSAAKYDTRSFINNAPGVTKNDPTIS